MTMQVAAAVHDDHSNRGHSNRGGAASRRKRSAVVPALCLALVGGAAGGIVWSGGGWPNRAHAGVETEAETWARVEAWVVSTATATSHPFPVSIAMVFAR